MREGPARSRRSSRSSRALGVSGMTRDLRCFGIHGLPPTSFARGCFSILMPPVSPIEKSTERHVSANSSPARMPVSAASSMASGITGAISRKSFAARRIAFSSSSVGGKMGSD